MVFATPWVDDHYMSGVAERILPVREAASPMQLFEALAGMASTILEWVIQSRPWDSAVCCGCII